MKKVLVYAISVIGGLVILIVGAVAVRQVVANSQIAREWQVIPASAPGLGNTSKLEILPIYDANGGGGNTEPGFGVSYLVRTDSATVLMDLGNNPAESAELPAVHNLAALGVDWADIDAIVISHPHPDHTGGTQAWQDKTISFGNYAGDLSAMAVYVPAPLAYSGAKLIYSAEPVLVAKDIATTGVISYPEVFPLSVLEPKGHEQALVFNVTGKGLVLVTGCGHPTLEKLVSRAETLFGQPVVGIVGGLHYQDMDSQALQSHIQFLQSRNPVLVALSPHDSGPEAIAAWQAAFPDTYQSVRLGEAIQFP